MKKAVRMNEIKCILKIPHLANLAHKMSGSWQYIFRKSLLIIAEVIMLVKTDLLPKINYWLV